MTAGNMLGDLARELGPSHFSGYGSQLQSTATVVALLQSGRRVNSIAAGRSLASA